MQNGLGFKKVNQHLARNPVAQAISRRLMQSAVLEFQIGMYDLGEGANAAGYVDVSQQVLQTAIHICEIRGQGKSPDCNVMRGGKSAIDALEARGGIWRKVDARAIDQALIRAHDIYRTAQPKEVQRAYLKTLSANSSAKATA